LDRKEIGGVPTVLIVNKFWHDVGPAGGVGRYVLQEAESLGALGWRVVPFAIADADARPSEWRRWFVKARDYRTPRHSFGALSDAAALLWNREAARKLDGLLHEARPDVAHLHNIYHHLSASLLPVLARHRVPVVMTLHDLRLLCPEIHMLRHGHVCERCQGGRFQQAVLWKCVKSSRAASLLAAVETANQHYRRLYPRHVRRFLCPSRFFVAKYAEWGYPASRLEHMPNFVDLETWQPEPLDPQVTPSYLYFGRLSHEKGLSSLLVAQARWEAEGGEEYGRAPAPLLRIAGEGPAADELRRQAADLRLRRVEWLGALAGRDLRAAVARARFTVIPSEWYENAPLSVLESMAAGRPVAGAAIGGIPELIDDGSDGVLFPAGDPAAILAGLRRAQALSPEAGARARARAERLWARPAHMERLAGILADTAAVAPRPA
jgi:glycosyltransferase involved in cell wall biosynthesis